MYRSANPVPIDISFSLPKPVPDIVKDDPLSSTMINWQLAFIASQFVSLTIGLVEMDQCFNFTKRIKGNRIAHSKAPNCTDASA
jgi:hypothetical protein